uniref:Uncharacterized protein n=1 Tax=Anguilla anguilla TaxID=7936 RepID=A0A0E9WL76_ANGAN
MVWVILLSVYMFVFFEQKSSLLFNIIALFLEGHIHVQFL